jgi:lipopolysaccharide transport system permease protein
MEVVADRRPMTVIERRPLWRLADWGELWRARGLLVALAWRDVQVRYKQTVLGALWAVLQPAAGMLAFSVFLRRLGSADAAAVPYPLFVYAGLLPWALFAGTVSAASQSVIGNPNLVTKVYCPRLVLPLAAAGAPLVDFLVGSALLAALMAGYGVGPGWGVLLAPLLLLGVLAAAVGLGALLAALTVAYRDFRYVVPFVVQLGLFLTPAVFLQVDHGLGPTAQALAALNPLNGLIGGSREALLGGAIDAAAVTSAFAMALAWLAAGCLYFRTVERRFADVI